MDVINVGIYGPSGCGKSSLVKAGLIPRLSKDVLPIYVEATAADTEVRLIKALRKHCPDLPKDDSLPEMIVRLRENNGWRGRKVLLVLDQFEQWLHAHESREDSQLVPALRQCDGGGVQCVVLVRDDFWMSATGFMQALEVPLLEGHNSAAVNLFDADHVRKVLLAFGRAYEKLPESPAEPDDEQARFLQQAVDGLADEGKVICVRLAVFAEMMKGKSWTEGSLRESGGTEGVGVNFLEETLSAKTAPPSYRLHQQAVRAVLKALLPEEATDIRGQMRPYDELLQESGYLQRQADFETLLRILDGELRLITPTEPDEMDTEDDGLPASEAKYYQLTHDFLVPSLREWLTRKKRETRRGRAELWLEELAALWNRKPEHRHLPSPWEYVRIRSLTNSAEWSDPERKMMRRADRVRGTRFVAAFCLLFATVGSSLFGWNQYRRSIAKGYVEQLLRTSADGVQPFTELTRPYKSHAIPMLLTALNDPNRGPRLHAACALAEYGESDFAFPLDALENCSPDEGGNVFSAFQIAPGRWNPELVDQIEAADQQHDWPFKARLAILALHQGDLNAAEDMLGFLDQPDPIERTVFIDTLAGWHGDLGELVQHVKSAEHPGLRSGICLAVGKVEEIDAGTRALWQELLSAWHQDQPDSGTHSATGWTLRQRDMPVPEIDVAKNESQDFDWIVTKQARLSMIRIPAGTLEVPANDEKQTLDVSEFWLSDREISIDLFQQFIADKRYQGERPRDWEGAYSWRDVAAKDRLVSSQSPALLPIDFLENGL